MLSAKGKRLYEKLPPMVVTHKKTEATLHESSPSDDEESSSSDGESSPSDGNESSSSDDEEELSLADLCMYAVKGVYCGGHGVSREGIKSFLDDYQRQYDDDREFTHQALTAALNSDLFCRSKVNAELYLLSDKGRRWYEKLPPMMVTHKKTEATLHESSPSDDEESSSSDGESSSSDDNESTTSDDNYTSSSDDESTSTLEGHTNSVNSAGFSPDGTKLVSCSGSTFGISGGDNTVSQFTVAAYRNHRRSATYLRATGSTSHRQTAAGFVERHSLRGREREEREREKRESHY